MKTIIINLWGERESVRLPIAQYESTHKSSENYGAGVSLTGIWRGPLTGRMFVRTYSIWDNGRGAHVGERIYEVDKHGYLRACQVAKIQPTITATDV